jgi:hypothetical protein
MKRFEAIVLLVLLAVPFAVAQQPEPQDTGKPLAVTPTVRLAAAKKVYLKNGGGSDTPFDVISMSFSEWSRFTMVDDPAQADLVVEVTSPDDGKKKDKEGGGFTASAQGKQVGGHRDAEPPTSKRSDVLMAVRDAKTKATLWSGTEKPNSVEKGMSKDEKFAAAGTRLMSRFREKIEPNIAR